VSWREIDLGLFLGANTRWTAPWLDRFFVWLTNPPHLPLVLFALAALVATARARGVRTLITLVIVVALADQFAAQILKPLFDRVRPCFVLPDVRLLLSRQPHSPSFPSNHAINSFAAAAVLFDLGPVVGGIGLVLAALVSYSRIYVGVHYPSDVLAGAILGLTLGRAAVAFRGTLSAFCRGGTGFWISRRGSSRKR
jgi:undecaprenyl-diphosphatase